MPNLLVGKSAIVTGAASGIGRAIALAFLREGASVLGADLNLDGLKETADLGKEHEPAFLTHRCDVTQRADVEATVERAVAEFGKLDIMAAIAGIAMEHDFVDIEDEDWHRTAAVNMHGVYLCDQVAARQMVEQGSGGRIINMSSVNGLMGEEELAAYNTSKGAVTLLTKSAAIDLAKHEITVNCLAPGYIRTPLNEEGIADEAWITEYLKRVPFRRVGEPEEVADCAVFLASDLSRYVTGHALVVDGGQIAVI
ncbi:MAG: SDR family NAD(P)-dependent oxidoreductase [Chloroflexota bacterium]|nr:SDR family NAD(P)-dependent oxidoreductase [Chloroflexota bacterium]MDE2929741.1 SDR family NAD(P)-dependent oxidoreductase [Chloroflexota bacterium]